MDPAYQDMLQTAVTTYLEDNGPTAPSPTMLWEALKPTVCGVEISYRTNEKRARWEQLEALETRQASLALQLNTDPNPVTRQNLLQAQQDLWQ